MKYILSSAQMQQCDKNTMEGYGVPSAVLMERAALAAAEEITDRFPSPSARILLACGTGNNGGDGLAMARLLFLKGYTVKVLFPGDEDKCSAEAARQLGIVRKYGIPVTADLPEEYYDVYVDALFGIGLSREIGGNYRTVIDRLNDRAGRKVAVDIPSGISADSGCVMGTAFRADLTVTFGFAKTGQMFYPGADYCGELIVKDIGIDEYSLCGIRPAACMPEIEDLSLLPERRADSNKGTCGKLLVFAGSRNMAGAAAFSARAAYRTGTGLVKVATEAANREIIQTLAPEAILAVYDEKTDIEDFVREQLDWADAVVLGPGIGRSRRAKSLVRAVLGNVKVPCLVDADGLNILSKHPDWLPAYQEDCAGIDGESRPAFVFTPHPGEMSRLCGQPADVIKSDILNTARRFADRNHVILVLKDARTVTAVPESMSYINRTGNHGMATAGSGDVLSGMIGSLLGQGVPADLAAPLGVMIHGLAGDAVAEKTGRMPLTASDIIEGICEVLP
ncbi:MAG: NAD(P)H-hydrate dehydratase [Clostridiales bacterium]|nr:NAD(P)H-hydrate dehydratase [Clostridiales bacterium]